MKKQLEKYPINRDQTIRKIKELLLSLEYKTPTIIIDYYKCTHFRDAQKGKIVSLIMMNQFFWILIMHIRLLKVK